MVDVDFELYSHSLLWLDCERRCIVTYIVMASEERYYGCRQKVSSERSLETQKHLDELQEFTSKLKIKEEARDVQVSISHDENYDKIWPSSNINVPSDIGHIQDDVKWAERAVGITTNIFDNFEISIRDWGGGGKSYFYEPILPPSGNLLNGVILSAWDNIIGPKAVFVWIQRAEQGTIGERVVQEAVEYTVGHTLHGELEKMNVGSTVARGTEVYLVEDLGFIIFSMPFSAQRDQDFVPHSLSFVIPSAEMKSFTNLNPLFSLWIQRLAYRLTGYLHHNDYGMALTELSPEIVELCHLLNSLSIAGLILAKVGIRRVYVRN